MGQEMTATQRYATLTLLAGVVILGFGAFSVGQTRRSDPFAAKLPDGEGKQAVLEFCAGACHLSDHFVDLRKTPDEWRKTVLQMVANGAQLFPEDIDAITKYLSTNLSSNLPANAAK
jgi:hypothetical protein